MNEIKVNTPVGLIKAVESPDRNNPGIIVQFFTKDGREMSACSMQYMEETEKVETKIWGKDEPEGDPAYETGFDAHQVKIDLIEPDGEPYQSIRTVAEFEKLIQEGKVDLDWDVKSAWVGDTEIAAATFGDVAEYLRRNYDFNY